MDPTTDFSQLPLRDIHLPGPVAWWPPAPGWWLLAALLVAALVLAAAYRYVGRHRRAAQGALRRVRTALAEGAEPVACLATVSTVLRRYAMTVDAAAGAPAVAGLIGHAWLDWLDSRWPRGAFAQGAGRLLLLAPYARPGSIAREQAQELAALCAAWLAAQPVLPRRTAGEPPGAARFAAGGQAPDLKAAT